MCAYGSKERNKRCLCVCVNDDLDKTNGIITFMYGCNQRELVTSVVHFVLG